MNWTWCWPKQCNGFCAWLLHEWDMRDHWDGPYKLWRRHGIRFLGLEVEWVYLQIEEE